MYIPQKGRAFLRSFNVVTTDDGGGGVKINGGRSNVQAGFAVFKIESVYFIHRVYLRTLWQPLRLDPFT